MTRIRPTAVAVFLTLVACGCVCAEESGGITATQIWDRGRHNAFTDLVRWQGRFYCTFREGGAHVPHSHAEDGKTRVIVSTDGATWKSFALFEEAGIDLRDPKLSVTPDDRLMVLMGGSYYESGKLGKRLPRVALIGKENAGPFKSVPVIIDKTISNEADWLWRVTWHMGTGYGVVYQKRDGWHVYLVKTTDGVRYSLVKTLNVSDAPNEATIRFLPGDEMMVVLRNEGGSRLGRIGRAKPPYAKWTWHTMSHRLGGPNFIRLPNGTLILGTRLYGKQTRTAIGPMSERGQFTPKIQLPSGGDTSYPGMLVQGDQLWVSYYASHEKKTAIYLAKIALSELTGAAEE